MAETKQELVVENAGQARLAPEKLAAALALVVSTATEENGSVDGELEKLRLDYEQALQTYRQLADIRFKLLAFVPTLSGAAVALLTRAQSIDQWGKVALAGLGFFATLGIVLYDQRNSQFYNGAITRAQHLEHELGLMRFDGDRHPGLFGSRKDHGTRHLLGIPVGHDLGLAFVYSPVLGAWAFLAVLTGVPARAAVAALVGLGVAALFFAQFEWNDGKPKHLKEWWERTRLPMDRATPAIIASHLRLSEEREPAPPPWSAVLHSFRDQGIGEVRTADDWKRLPRGSDVHVAALEIGGEWVLRWATPECLDGMAHRSLVRVGDPTGVKTGLVRTKEVKGRRWSRRTSGPVRVQVRVE